jgi:hypothetical protein
MRSWFQQNMLDPLNRFREEFGNIDPNHDPKQYRKMMGWGDMEKEGHTSVFDYIKRGAKATFRGAAWVGANRQPLGNIAMGLTIAAGIGQAATGNGAGILATTGLIVGGSLAYRYGVLGTLKHLPGAVWKHTGGVPGIATGVAHAGAHILGAGMSLLRTAEFGARSVLTGTLKGGVKGGMDAWFPNMRILPNTDIRRFSINPTVIKRLVGIGAAIGVASAAKDAISPGAPPPTHFFDGLNMHHINDMGAGAAYGQGILGRNSSLNSNYSQTARIAGIEAGEIGLRNLRF